MSEKHTCGTCGTHSCQAVRHIEDVEPKHIKTFLLRMSRNGRTANYINDLLKAYKVFFRYAYEEGYAQTLLTEKISNVKKPKVIIRTFSDEELKRISGYYHGHDFLSIRNKTIILLLIDTGIRLSELTELTEEQVKSDYIIIRGKGNKERVVPKSPLLSKWLIKYLAVRKSYFDCRILQRAGAEKDYSAEEEREHIREVADFYVADYSEIYQIFDLNVE